MPHDTGRAPGGVQHHKAWVNRRVSLSFSVRAARQSSRSSGTPSLVRTPIHPPWEVEHRARWRAARNLVKTTPPKPPRAGPRRAPQGRHIRVPVARRHGLGSSCSRDVHSRLRHDQRHSASHALRPASTSAQREQRQLRPQRVCRRRNWHVYLLASLLRHSPAALQDCAAAAAHPAHCASCCTRTRRCC